MNTHDRPALPHWIAACMVCGFCCGADKPPPPPVKPPAEQQVHGAVVRALDFVARGGEQWMQDKNCNSCHHTPLLLWSHRLAEERGFAVDAGRYDEWLAWSLEHATKRKTDVEELALMILALPQRSAPEFAKALADTQKPDGSWAPAGQFNSMQKRGSEDAADNSTRLHLLALDVEPSSKAVADAAHAKASARLQAKGRSTAVESLVFRVLHALRHGTKPEAESLCSQLVKLQRGEGGWSSFIGENMSDPLATGQVLHALQAMPLADAASRDAIARAQHWLLQTQREDGSWGTDITHVSQMDRSAPAKAKSFKDATEIYHYWGSVWAVIGLLEGLPLVK